MKPGKVVIFGGDDHWYGAVEYVAFRRWSFKADIRHAPITHATTPEEVFKWLRQRYPDRVITYDPAVSKRYGEV